MGITIPILALFIAGCSSSTGADSEEEKPRVVDAATVLPANGSSEITLSGRVKAAEQTELSFEISGKIERLTVDVGDNVEAGETLAVLEDARYQLEYDRAVATEQEAKAALDEARLAYNRQNSLREKGYTSQSQLDSAEASLESARSRYESAVASRRLAARDLRLTELKAPFSGSISQRHVEPAERVSPNQAVLDVISDRDGFEVETSVAENLVGHLNAKSLHTITIPALGGEPVPASIKHIGTQPQSSNNYPIILALEEPVGGLRSGMTAQVHLDIAAGDMQTLEEGDSAVRVPLTALVYDTREQAHVLRLDEDNRLERIELDVLAVSEQIAAVAGALSPGDRIVARGAEFVSEGQKVSVMGQGPERYN
ncbi:efflux RND transporter periplasmic adaptor subunit [Marinobacter nanhaiticus D15-8W]|uniref:Efflux RND transporter periplasmic adaptor subunit n=2 Tax=Marinobacter TaxID=2742 RepID=N6X626_9GAMM|nr:efflux RND transporter periplasmic adaptor subunit [Marinobacter nanhaiticus D15-8W]